MASMAKSLMGGLAGAIALNLVHEAGRHMFRDAPRVDLIGRRAIGKLHRAMGKQPPGDPKLYGESMAADIASNAIYYALASYGKPKHAMLRATTLGTLGGLGARYLPPMLGLGRQPTQNPAKTTAMNVAWYLIGALVAAGVAQTLASKSSSDDDDGEEQEQEEPRWFRRSSNARFAPGKSYRA